VKLRVRVDDKAELYGPPCVGSNRDDPYIVKEFLVNVVLPEGCNVGGSHDNSVHWIQPNDNIMSATCPLFGQLIMYEATYDVNFVYQDCSWRCQITNVKAETKMEVRCPKCIPGKISVSSPADVRCYDANLAKTDLHDADLTDDTGAPRTKYWCYPATLAHEGQHRQDWQRFYAEELTSTIRECENISVQIECGKADTLTCQNVLAAQRPRIIELFEQAWRNAEVKYDDPNTPLDEAEQRAYKVSALIEGPISAALPAGCKP